MLKYFIIISGLLGTIFILFVKLEVRITKRHNEPLCVKIVLFKKTIIKKIIQKNSSKNVPFHFSISYIFENNLNVILKDVKENNFFIYLFLEFARIKKITIIPLFNSTNPDFLPFIGFGNWFLNSLIKSYIDHSFKHVQDEYYQIILLDDYKQGLDFEIYATILVGEIGYAIIKKFKVFLKLFKKKEKAYK